MPVLDLTNVANELDVIRRMVTARHNIVDAEGDHSDLTEDDIRQSVQTLKPFAPTATAAQFEVVVRTLCEEWGIIDLGDSEPDDGGTVEADHEEWLEKALREGNVKWRRWSAYKKLLRHQGRSPQVVNDLDDATTRILDLAGNPREESIWIRKGLAIGDVQSGKTQTFLAVANKAADAGYKVIIVLAGNTEYLRKQTQERVDSDFIGRDGSKLLKKVNSSASTSNRMGIGLLDKTLHANGMTTPFYDYLQLKNEGHNLALVSKDSEHPYIFVVKKNSFVLDAVDQWSKNQADGAGIVDAAALIIDDESDYASVDTSADGSDPTKINQAIRRILSRYGRSSYLAVTATPFANIFINHEGYGDVGKKPKKGKTSVGPEAETLETKDLFPEDYIHALKAPKNYVGLKRTFGTYDEPVVDGLHDNSDCESTVPLKHAKDREIEQLPESLVDAIDTYVLANAVFDLRGRAKDARSMIINVSKFTEVQNRLADLVQVHLARTQEALEAFGGIEIDGQHGQSLAGLKSVFEEEFPECGSTWEEVLAVLPDSASSIRVKVYNSKPNRLGEDEAFEAGVPSRQIAIGGDLLSRGLTLNNLLTSYFYRSPMAADTLMQMARWFGYRDGYFDLVRLWIPSEKRGDYQFVEQAVRQLKRQIKTMSEQGLTPLDFGLAVQQHPESLLITARNKSRNTASAPSTIDLTNYRLETTKVPTDLEALQSNERALDLFAAAMGMTDAAIAESTTVVRGVDKNHIARFLEEFKFSPADRRFDSVALGALVRGSSSESYTQWDVVFVGGHRDNDRWSLPTGLEMPRLVTRVLSPRDGYFAVSGTSSRLAGSQDLRHVLSAEKLATMKVDGKLPSNEEFYYQHMDRPALLIYALKPVQTVKLSTNPVVKREDKIEGVTSVVAVKLAMPRTKKLDTDIGRDGVATYLHNSVAALAWKARYAALEGEESQEKTNV
jgi:hypothetical protein